MGKSIGIILSGGIGTRMNIKNPKQYIELLGKEILEYSVNAFKNSKRLDDFYIVANNGKHVKERIESQYGIRTISAGISRNGSLKNALDFIHENVKDCEKLFVNEAARPMITPEIIDSYLKKLDEYDYVFSAAKITDSLSTIDHRYADRSQFYLVRSPEGYHFKDLYAYFDDSTETTYPGHVLPADRRGYCDYEYKDNYKITYQEDLALVEYLLRKRQKQLTIKELLSDKK
jgi:2-C-methyl-D-erythritol 4-phosphate cytidylyltransferase